MKNATFLSGFIATSVCFSGPAFAKIDLRCYEGPAAIAQLKAELKAEDQQPVLVGNRTGGVWNANLFTSDREGRIGYNVEGNQRFGSGIESTTLCVKGKYRAIVLNDVSKPGIPPWALVGGAGAHDVTVRTGARNGFYMAMGAISLVPTPDGGERDGPLMMVGFGPNDKKRGGSMSITNAQGSRQILFSMVDMQFAPRGIELLSR